ncbi:transposase [Trichonephila clavipes]|nr:transposase [Trichonephila clavipes]
MRNGSHTTILCENDRGQNADETVNSDTYGQQLYCLKLAIDQKRPELAKEELCSNRGVMFHQEQARPHTSVVTRQKLWELGWEVLVHPPYSPDLTPSDYYLFSHCKNFLSDKKLGSREDCQRKINY